MLPLLSVTFYFIDLRRASFDLKLDTMTMEARTTQLGGWFDSETRLFFLFCMFCSPSFKFLLLFYVPSYVITVVFLLLTYGDHHKPTFLDPLTLLPMYASFCIACFFVL